jgi:cation:H+ antiporter
MLSDGFILVIGLVLLGLGGECLVRGAAQLARRMGVSALVVGLTVVAFGTSTPEIAVTMSAGAHGHHDIAIANVVGSCTLNILIVLGLAALTKPMRVSRNVINTDGPIMIGALALFLLFASHRLLERWMGAVFLALLAAYIVMTVVLARRQTAGVKLEYETGLSVKGPWFVDVVVVVLGLVGLSYGADLVLSGATGIARSFGIEERIIGLTIVALGTSLPEIVTCVVAARRNQPDIAIGNVVGSNIFNIFGVLGLTASVYPLEVSAQTFFFDGPIMLAAAIITFPILRTGHRISRPEGVFLIALYCAYLGLVL